METFDSIPIRLLKNILQGKGRNPIDCKKKGEVKVFIKMNLAGDFPNSLYIRAASTNEKMVYKPFNLPEYSIRVWDKRYVSYK